MPKRPVSAITPSAMKKQIENQILLPKVAELIAAGHRVTLTVRGQSMNPFLRDGRDRVTLAPFRDDELQPGQVVLAREQGTGRFLLHRILRREDVQLTLLGDGNVGLTEQTDTGRVIGRVTEVERKGRRYPVEGPVWRRYSRAWRLLTPLRRLLLGLYRRLPHGEG